MNDLDRPNGDLKAKDRVLITSWCKDLELGEEVGVPARVAVTYGGVYILPSPERPRRFLFYDVVEIVAVCYPFAVVDVHSIKGGEYQKVRTALNLTEFECIRASEEYCAAVLPPPPPPPHGTQPILGGGAVFDGTSIVLGSAAAGDKPR